MKMNKKLANQIMKNNDLYEAREIFKSYGYEMQTTMFGYFSPMGISNPNGDYILYDLNNPKAKPIYYKI